MLAALEDKAYKVEKLMVRQRMVFEVIQKKRTEITTLMEEHKDLQYQIDMAMGTK